MAAAAVVVVKNKSRKINFIKLSRWELLAFQHAPHAAAAFLKNGVDSGGGGGGGGGDVF